MDDFLPFTTFSSPFLSTARSLLPLLLVHGIKNKVRIAKIKFHQRQCPFSFVFPFSITNKGYSGKMGMVIFFTT